LGIDIGKLAETGLPIENRLGTRVEKLLVCGEDGGLYWAEDLANGGKTNAQPVEPTDAVNRLRAAITACKMVYPPGMDGSNMRYRYRRWGYYGSRSDAPNPSPSMSLLENTILQATGPSGISRTYMAIVDLSPEVELGTPQAKPEGSLHVVVGSW
jgi:hypothetical protein